MFAILLEKVSLRVYKSLKSLQISFNVNLVYTGRIFNPNRLLQFY